MTIEHACARFVSSDGAKVYGTGVVTGSGRVLTYAHVVNAAIGQDKLATENPDKDLYFQIPGRPGWETVFSGRIDLAVALLRNSGGIPLQAERASGRA